MKDNLYEKAIEINKRRTLEEIVDNKFQNKPIFPGLDIKWPINHFFNLKENFLLESEVLDKLRVSDSIYRQLRTFILNNISAKERDIIALYNTYGDMASFPYDIDEKRQSNIQKEFTLSTELGKLTFEFTNREKYNVSNDLLLTYDDIRDVILLFVDNENYIRTEELINLLRKKYRFIHELTHYIDKINKVLTIPNYTNDIEYLNDPNEVRGNIQMLIYSFGAYIFKNSNNLTQYNLKNKKDINKVFEIFLSDTSNKNVVDNEDLAMMRKEVYYMYPENKEKLYTALHKYIIDEYGTDEDINYKESHSKENLIRLLRLEERVINEVN